MERFFNIENGFNIINSYFYRDNVLFWKGTYLSYLVLY